MYLLLHAHVPYARSNKAEAGATVERDRKGIVNTENEYWKNQYSKDSQCSVRGDKAFLLENPPQGGAAAMDLGKKKKKKKKREEIQSHILYLKIKKTTRCNYIHD